MKNENQVDDDIKVVEAHLKKLKRKKAGSTDDQNPYLIPASILFASILIASSVVFYGKQVSNAPVVNPSAAAVRPATPPPTFGSGASENVKKVTAEDHIRGSLDAPVKIIEFSDYECPFCKRVHPTLSKIAAEYADSGQVAWVYRHFPLDSLHPFKARNEALASECAAELGGNDAFWAFSDRIFEITPSNNQLDQALLPEIAEYIGLDRGKFEACMSENKYADHIESDYQDAVASGGSGTPFSIVVAPNGKTFPVSGAQPYTAFKSIIELALKEK